VFSSRFYNRYQKAAHGTLEFDPKHPHAGEFLAGVYRKKGDFDRYMAENIRHTEFHGAPAGALEPLKRAYMSHGPASNVQETERLSLARTLLQRYQHWPEAAQQTARNCTIIPGPMPARYHCLGKQFPSIVH
jgi:hypothetical protein